MGEREDDSDWVPELDDDAEADDDCVDVAVGATVCEVEPEPVDELVRLGVMERVEVRLLAAVVEAVAVRVMDWVWLDEGELDDDGVVEDVGVREGVTERDGVGVVDGVGWYDR